MKKFIKTLINFQRDTAGVNFKQGMGTPLIITIVAGLFVVGGVAFFNMQPEEEIMMEEGEAMMEEGEAMMEEGEAMMEEGEAMMEEGEAMAEDVDSLFPEGETKSKDSKGINMEEFPEGEPDLIF